MSEIIMPIEKMSGGGSGSNAYTSHTQIQAITSNASGRWDVWVPNLTSYIENKTYRNIAFSCAGMPSQSNQCWWWYFLEAPSQELISYIMNTFHQLRLYNMGPWGVQGWKGNWGSDTAKGGFDVTNANYPNTTGYLLGFN